MNYGPFTLGRLRGPNEIYETEIPTNINNYLMYRYKDKVKQKLQKLENTRLESIKEQLISTQKYKQITNKSTKVENKEILPHKEVKKNINSSHIKLKEIDSQ